MIIAGAGPNRSSNFWSEYPDKARIVAMPDRRRPANDTKEGKELVSQIPAAPNTKVNTMPGTNPTKIPFQKLSWPWSEFCNPIPEKLLCSKIRITRAVSSKLNAAKARADTTQYDVYSPRIGANAALTDGSSRSFKGFCTTQ